MKLFLNILLLLASFQFVTAQPQRTKNFNLSDGSLALQGYDPVAYLLEGRASEGSSRYAAEHEGVRYYFTSEQHRKLFVANPARYEPQYGGWCAYAMGATGEKVNVDPETFKIIDGKLFLFYNRFFNNTLKSWNKDETTLHAKADHNWNKIIFQ